MAYGRMAMPTVPRRRGPQRASLRRWLLASLTCDTAAVRVCSWAPLPATLLVAWLQRGFLAGLGSSALPHSGGHPMTPPFPLETLSLHTSLPRGLRSH